MNNIIKSNSLFVKGKVILFSFVSLLLFSCGKECHEIPQDVNEGKSALVTVTLNTDEVKSTPLNNINLYWFDETDMLYRHDYYGSMQELGLAKFVIPVGSYTIVAVMNVGKNLSITNGRPSSSDVDLATFSKFIVAQTGNYPELLTGTLRNIVKYGSQLFYIDLADKTHGMKDSSVDLLLKLPSSNLPDYVYARSIAPFLRATAHIFKKGSNELYATRRVMLQPTQINEEYKMSLSLFEGEYDINLWVDYSTNVLSDYHYITTNSNVMRIPDKSHYSANSDFHDAFSQCVSINVINNESQIQNVEMHRPLAKYRIVATDVDKYNEMRIKKNLPELSNLKVFIGYEGFLPTAYSISENKSVDADQGYLFNTILGTPSEGNVNVAKDFIFVNGTESSVSVTILFKDKDGKIVSGVNGVKIAYRVGQLTTISGNFLTSGIGSGINIDTSWDDDLNVEF